MKNQKKLNTVKKQLIESRSFLISQVSSTKDDRKPVELDQASVGRLSRIDAIQLQEMALEQKRRRMVQVKKIDSALNRLNTGEYGLCIKCEGPISAKRLAFDPAVALCVDCANI